MRGVPAARGSRRTALAATVLAALLVLVATLQYRWTGELGKAAEERARTDLGMIGKAETFYQVVTDEKQAAAAKIAQPELVEPVPQQPAPERPNE